MNDTKEALNTQNKQFLIILNEFKRQKLCKRCLNVFKVKSGAVNVVRCSRKGCRYECNLLESPVFKDVRIKWNIIVDVIFLWYSGVRNKTISEILHVNKQSVSKILKNVDIVLKNKKNRFCKPIGGNRIIVEADESKFGKNKYNRGHLVKGVWIFGLVERTIARRIVLIPVKKRNKEKIHNLINNYVYKKSILYTDCWKAYNGIKDFDYGHMTVNHSKFFKDDVTGVHTNSIEGNWCALKNSITPRYRTSKYAERYCNLFMIKRNINENSFIFLLNLLVY